MTKIPNSLIRCLEKEEYAHSFLKGEIRFGLLDYYKKIEDSRQDKKEGEVSFYWNQKAPQLIIDKKTGEIIGKSESNKNIHCIGSSLNPYYILCTSHPEADIDILKKKYGQVILLINDPLKLLERIKIAWSNHPLAFNGCAFIAPVVYNKEGVLEPDPYLLSPPEYSYSQKHSSDMEDRECRYVLKCRVDTNRKLQDVLFLSVPNCSDICSLG
ncbi:MAG: hypothetical protein ABIN18_28095 [Pseudomonadota bacterium]